MGNSSFIPASNVSEKFTGDEYLADFLTENCFYRQMVEDLKKCNVDLVSEDPLETIYNCICHLNNLFRVLRRPWSIECGKNTKALLIMLLMLNSQSKRMRLLLMRQMALYLRSVISRNGMILFVRCNNSFVIRKKELKQVFKKQKQKVVSNDKPVTEITTYCMTVGKSEIYGMTYGQLEELYKAVGLFIKREKSSF